MLSVTAARWLIVVHAILGGAAVTAATHWVVWMWPFRRGVYTRLRGAKRFGVIAMTLYVCAFLVGGVLYPTYKARVKLEYFKNPAAVEADRAARVQAGEDVLARWEGRTARTLEPGAVERVIAGEA